MSDAIEVLAGQEASLLDYQDVGVLMLLSRSGLTIAETPVPMLPRRAGRSRVFKSWPVVARYMMHTTVLCLAQLDPARRHHARRSRSDMLTGQITSADPRHRARRRDPVPRPARSPARAVRALVVRGRGGDVRARRFSRN